jgi:hypothetical protein
VAARRKSVYLHVGRATSPRAPSALPACLPPNLVLAAPCPPDNILAPLRLTPPLRSCWRAPAPRTCPTCATWPWSCAKCAATR